jgi:hypothetical protein
MKKLNNYRQGEVLMFGMDPTAAQMLRSRYKGGFNAFKKIPDNVIIEGEISGHKHEVINGKLYQHPDKKDVMILEAGNGCIVKHPEHKDVPMPKGVYEINIQREYSEGKASRVKD